MPEELVFAVGLALLICHVDHAVAPIIIIFLLLLCRIKEADGHRLVLLLEHFLLSVDKVA